MIKKSAMRTIVLRGLAFGLLATFISALSLPILLDLAVRIQARLAQGLRYENPWAILGLWPVLVVLGAIYSFMPNLLMGIALMLNVRRMWSETAQNRRLRMRLGLIVGAIAGMIYVVLMFLDPLSGDPIVRWPQDGLLVVFITAEQAAVYGGLAARSQLVVG